jgi:hypothetical protein
MEITSKFKIGDLICHKYDISDDQKNAMEVIEVQTVTCSAGTQVFYHCRPIVALKEFDGYDEMRNKIYKWKVCHGILTKDTNSYQRYREDEVIECDEETYNLIKGLRK